MYRANHKGLTPRPDAAEHVVLHPPEDLACLELVVILAHGRERQHWCRTSLLGIEPDYLFPTRLILGGETVWTWQGNYLSYVSLRYLVTGFTHGNSHHGLTTSAPEPFQHPTQHDDGI